MLVIHLEQQSLVISLSSVQIVFTEPQLFAFWWLKNNAFCLKIETFPACYPSSYRCRWTPKSMISVTLQSTLFPFRLIFVWFVIVLYRQIITNGKLLRQQFNIFLRRRNEMRHRCGSAHVHHFRILEPYIIRISNCIRLYISQTSYSSRVGNSAIVRVVCSMSMLIFDVWCEVTCDWYFGFLTIACKRTLRFRKPGSDPFSFKPYTLLLPAQQVIWHLFFLETRFFPFPCGLVERRRATTTCNQYTSWS